MARNRKAAKDALSSRIAELEAENERLARLNIGLHDELQFMRKAAKENRERHQEPVAWRYRYNGKWYVCDSESFARNGWDVTPLYTRPSERAVTEALIDKVLDAAGDYMSHRYGDPTLNHPTARARIKAAMEAGG